MIFVHRPTTSKNSPTNIVMAALAVAGAVIGSALAYWLDPLSGGRRRRTLYERAGLTVRHLSELPARRAERTARRRGIELVKEITVDAPVGEVYDFWRTPENLPLFLSHVKEVRPLKGGRYRWVVGRATDGAFDWNVKITADDPNRLIAWRTINQPSVPNWGVVRFDPTPEGGTHLNVRFAFHPPEGIPGQAFAAVLGDDPELQLEQDLEEFKMMVEGGVTAGAS